MIKKLNLHSSCQAQHIVEVDWKVDGDQLNLKFWIDKAQPSQWNISNEFKTDHYGNWGLWDYDVVEAFLQFRENEEDQTAEYLEIQVSPLNQQFALNIIQPRVCTYSPLNFSFESKVQLTDRHWETEIIVKAPKNRLVFGNLTACIGAQSNREFWALNINKEHLPDFHQTKLFSELIS